MNKGTPEGSIEEIEFVKELNRKKDSIFWRIFNVPYSTGRVFAIHVISHKFGKINNSKVKPKADVFLCTGSLDDKIIKKKKYYLNENDMNMYHLKPIPNTGISVKRKDSKRYQILKMNTKTFKKIFGSAELGAGASIYCRNEKEFYKNDSVLNGWGTTWKKFEKYFGLKDKPNREELMKIKIKSNKNIHDIIDGSKSISDFVFRGVGNFDEPFTATWFYESGELKRASKIPFIVTTGSGRSQSIFTIEIKPR